MKLKRIIVLALATMMSISSFSGLYITSSAAELASYIWDLTDCGEASGNESTTKNNCTTLIAGENISNEYTEKISTPTDGKLSFNLSRGNTKATISDKGLVAPGNGVHIYFTALNKERLLYMQMQICSMQCQIVYLRDTVQKIKRK